ncbi:FAD-binding protein [Streptomyces europaeiscabiei]|uniref:FAD-binding protein n=1 Tax=Streptomyces europaeiscabiei TaxID=146819 RepID=UPI002D21B056|nr:FAD-binding protein [Streptomyces europaeiscabiei]
MRTRCANSPRRSPSRRTPWRPRSLASTASRPRAGTRTAGAATVRTTTITATTHCRTPISTRLTADPSTRSGSEAGDLGTKGGVLTDAQGRVLRPDGSVIPGLYATGNASAAVMGNEYAGAGATIGPAMVFSYLAMEHAAKSAAG